MEVVGTIRWSRSRGKSRDVLAVSSITATEEVLAAFAAFSECASSGRTPTAISCSDDRPMRQCQCRTIFGKPHVENWTLRSAKALILRELAAAEQTEMQALRHLRNAGEEWINIKAALGEKGININDWCKKNMPVSRQWLDRHAELFKNWKKLLAAKEWAAEVDYTSRRQSGLEFALELIAAKDRSDSIAKASERAVDATSGVVASGRLDRVTFLTGDALAVLKQRRLLCDIATLARLVARLRRPKAGWPRADDRGIHRETRGDLS